VGTLKTDLAGNSYITTGTSGTIRKINTSGTPEWTGANNGPAPEIEFWSLYFNCDYTKLYCGGMRASNGINIGSYRGTVFELSLVNGAITGFKEVGYTTGGFPPTIKEVRSIATSPNQNIYYLTLDSIGVITPSFNTLFQIPSGFNFSYGIPDYGVTNQGIHAVTATEDFLYTMNGNSIQRRNINSGTIINSAGIPGGINNTVPILGGTTPGNSGLVLDTCGNVYVGSATAVHKFSPTLNLLATYNTPSAVYDVALNYNGEVVACGNNFITSINTLNPCPPPPPICLNCIQITPVPPLCSNAAPITLSVNQTGGTWSGPGITDAVTGVFNPATAGTGTHVIHYTINPAPTCGADSIVITVTNCSPPAVCIDDNGNLVASGGAGGPYTWEQETTQQDCSACLFGCVLPPGCAQTITAWSPFASGNNINPPAVLPFRLVDANGNFVQINNLSELLPCTDCPGLTVTVVSTTNPICAGQNNGTASVNVSGGTAPYTYVWQPGNLSGASQNTLAQGNYLVTVTDSENCTGSVNFTLSAPPPITISVGSVTPADCNIANGTAAVVVSGGTGPLDVLWSLTPPQNTLSVSNLATGNYLVTVSDSIGCSDSISVYIGVVITDSTLSVTPEITNESCLGNDGSILLNVSEGVPPYSFLWGGGGVPDTSLAQGLTAGNYTVTVSDQCYSLVIEVTLEQSISIPAKDLPNIITPNNDGVNDLLDLDNQFESAKDFSASVYNRWGVPVHRSENKSILWSAENVSDGVYFLIVTYTDCTGKQEKLKGTVTVAR
jgi:gliding motility-associated-like protein